MSSADFDGDDFEMFLLDGWDDLRFAPDPISEPFPWWNPMAWLREAFDADFGDPDLMKFGQAMRSATVGAVLFACGLFGLGWLLEYLYSFMQYVIP